MLVLRRFCTFSVVLFTVSAIAAAEDRFNAQRAARDILDDSLAAEKREQLVDASVPHAAEVVRAMTKDMPDDQAEEYRRIPWIWRVAIAAGKKNDEKALRELLDASLPTKDTPLADWQAVVIGGGIINGVSQAGQWPTQRIKELLSVEQYKQRCWSRWERTIELAATMVDNEETPTGTRYDALRILGAASWDKYGEMITKYLASDVHEELQMGAISAAGDFDDDQAVQALLNSMQGFTQGNRSIAIDTLLEPMRHFTQLREAVRDGRVREEWLSDEQKQKLKQRTPR
jgi:hypothetical protein